MQALFIETNNKANVDIINNKETFIKYKIDINNFDIYNSNALDSIKDLKSNLAVYDRQISELNYKLRQIEIQYKGLNDLSNMFGESQEKAMVIEDIIEDLEINDCIQKKFQSMREILNEELSKINVNKSNNLEYEKFKIKKELKEIKSKRKNDLVIFNCLMQQYNKDEDYVDKIKKIYKLEARIEDGFDRFSSFLNEMKASLIKFENKAGELEQELELKKEALDKKLKNFEFSISSYINEDIKGFYPDFEHKQKIIGFDLRNMTCYYDTGEEKVFLSGWGSDNNLLFAHVAANLAFQRTLSNYQTCIPSFIVFDQLSRPYFPDSLEIEKSKDMISLKQIFNVILRVIKEVDSNTNSSLQVIAIEHANEGMPDFYLNSKIKDDEGNYVTFTNGIKYINEKIFETDVFNDERKKNIIKV